MKRILSILIVLLMLVGCSAVADKEGDGYIDHYTKGNFRTTHDVYSGPGEQYFRAADGKAMYGSGVVRYYGSSPEGWMLIGYSINSGLYRLGYIKATYEDLVTKEDDRVLNLMDFNAVTLQPIDFFDNPGIGDHASQPLVKLPQNAEVKYLGEFSHDWTYIEIGASYFGKPARGFVSAGNLVTIAVGPGQPGEGSSGSYLLIDRETGLKWDTTSMAWSRNVDISCDAEWKAIPDVPWIFLSADSNRLKIQLSENLDKDGRKGTINLNSGTTAAQIIVMQGGQQE